MIVDLGDIVKSKLAGLTFVDRLSGVVKILTKEDVTEDNVKVINKFPVSAKEDWDTCASGDYSILLPDSNASAIMFLEDAGVSFVGKRGRKQSWRASLRLVCWLNIPKLGFQDLSLSSRVIVAIIAAMPDVPFSSGIYNNCRIEVQGQDPYTGGNPFSNYTIEESKMQFLMYPYEAFSLPITVTFETDQRCLTDFTPQDSLICGPESTTSCPGVTILDPDGNVIQTVESGGSYTQEASGNVTVENSDASYSDTVAAGETLVLPDESFDVYVNGVLNTSFTYIPLSGDDINITG